jgi:hypothetical protein
MLLTLLQAWKCSSHTLQSWVWASGTAIGSGIATGLAMAMAEMAERRMESFKVEM